MNEIKRFFLIIGVLFLLLLVASYASNQIKVLGAPQVFVSVPATTSNVANFSFSVGTATPLSIYGSTTLAVYGSTTIQTPINTLYALRVINAASSSVFEVPTTASAITITNGFVSQASSTVVGDFTITGTCTGCATGAPVDAQYIVAALDGTLTAERRLQGTANQITLTDGGANGDMTLSIPTDLRVSSFTAGSSTVGFIRATSTTENFFEGGLISRASSTFTSTLEVTGAATFPGGVTITCTSCITDTNVSDTLTASNLIAASSVVADSEVDNDLTISGGTINNSTVGATVRSTGAFTTLNTTGLFNAYGNITATSTLTLDTGGLLDAALATVRITASSSLLTGTAGAIGIDTTSGQLRFSDGNNTQVLVSTTTIASANISSTTARFYGTNACCGWSGNSTSTFRHPGKSQAFTITQIRCGSFNATTTGQNAILSVGTGSATATPVTFCPSAGQIIPITAGGAIGANTTLLITIGTASSTLPDQVFFEIRGKYDSD